MPGSTQPARPPRHPAARGAVLLAWLAAAGCGGAGREEPPARPHVVIVSIDTLRADHLGCYGYERPTSPHIDALAGEAVLYERARSHSNSTAPSHLTLLSGVLPRAHGVRHREARGPSRGVPMLAEQLRAAGWRTAAFADGGFVTAPFGFARGFETFDSRLERFDVKLDRVERWLEIRDDRPAFLFVHTYGVHAPYLPAEEHDLFGDPAYDGRLVERVGALRDRLGPDGRWPPFEQTADAFWGDKTSFDVRDRARLVDLYDGCVHEVDAGVGRLLEMLVRRGWLDRAWLVVTSDHGEAFGEHGTWGHRQLHEEELHVPLIVRPPGGRPGGVRVRDAVGLEAVAPTLLQALGLRVPDAMRARPLHPLEAPGDRPVHAQAADAPAFEALIDDDDKLIVKGGGRTALYDLADDPGELRDLLAPDASYDAAGEARREALERLLDLSVRACEALRERLGGPVEEAPLDPAQLEALRALGYVR